MSEFNVQIPPDSTGKKIRHEAQIEIDYDSSAYGGVYPAFLVGEYVIFTTSDLQGTVMVDHQGVLHTEDHLHIKLVHGSPEDFVVGETMTVDGVPKAVAIAATDVFYIPSVIQAGGNNPAYLQAIDQIGASSVRFSEGSPQFDAFGKMQISNAHRIADYVLSYDMLPKLFENETVGTTASLYNHDTRGVTLQTGTGATDRFTRTTHRYHAYQAGVSQLFEITASCGDSGKVGVTRRVGAYDDDNGVYFEIADTQISVVLRSKSTGVVVETRINSENWTGDRLNGEGGAFNLSREDLDPSKDNVYWIDYQWLGAGTIRWGVLIAGERVTCHKLHNGNKNLHSYMSTGSLPLRVEQFNTAVTSTSELSFFCATVKTEGEYNPTYIKHAGNFSNSVTTTTAVPIVSIQPLQTFRGVNNRQVMSVIGATLFNASTSHMLVRFSENGTITGGTGYVAHNAAQSSAEVEFTGTAISGDQGVRYFTIPAGKSLDVDFTEAPLECMRNYIITGTTNINVTGELLAGEVGGGSLFVTLNWNELTD